MSNRKISKDTSKSTCSPESVAGRKGSGLQAGQQTNLFGQSLAPAPHSRLQDTPQSAQAAKADVLCGALDELVTQYARTAKTHGLPMPGTYGRKHGDLSRTYDQARSLANRLQVLMGSGGSPLYRLRWKFSAMPLSGWICRLRASGRRISGKDFSGWPTPNASNPRERQGFRCNGETPGRNKSSDQPQACGPDGGVADTNDRGERMEPRGGRSLGRTGVEPQRTAWTWQGLRGWPAGPVRR